MAGRSQANLDATLNQPSRFADEMQQLFGAEFDPDPQFLEESWTLGIPAAAENLHRRRQAQADRERQYRAFRELDTLGTLCFVEDRNHAAESLLTDRAATIASRYGATWPPQAAQTDAPDCNTQQNWSPAGGAPDDPITHSWIPQGGMPEAMQQRNETPQDAAPVDPLSGNGMTRAHAHQLLGVAAASSREQIRSAYRRIVGECHPDRLERASEAVRQRATRQMAAINEAYRLLCPTRQSEAA